LAKKENIETALKTIMSKNFVEGFDNTFNNMRSYVMGQESGLIMASWPKGRLKVPFPYFAESMSGFEYTAAIGMLYEGQTEAGLKCITAIRNRFDGEKRNPFDEPECGHHYARAMAAWSAPLALSGFNYSAADNAIGFTSKPGTYFWSNGSAWGTCKVEAKSAEFEVLYGEIEISKFSLGNDPTVKLKNAMLNANENSSVLIKIK
jgi:hypothetical protein